VILARSPGQNARPLDTRQLAMPSFGIEIGRHDLCETFTANTIAGPKLAGNARIARLPHKLNRPGDHA
jgi:hypothetical protein